MPDTGWITPKIGTVYIAGSGDSQITPINSGNITDPDLSQYMTVLLSNNHGTFYGEISKEVYFDWIDPDNYPGDAVVVGIEFAIIADFTTSASTSGNQTPIANSLNYQDRSIYSQSASIAPEDPTKIFEYSTASSPHEEDEILYGSPTSDFGFAGSLVKDLLTQKLEIPWDDAARSNQAYVRFIGGGGTPTKFAQLRIGTIRLKVYYEVPAVNINIASDISISTSINPDLSTLIDFELENVDLSVIVTPPEMSGEINLFSDVGISVDAYGVLSDIDFIDNDGQVFISVDVNAELVRYGNMLSDVSIGVTPYADSISYGRLLDADVNLSVNLQPPIMGKIKIITANILATIDVFAPAPDGTIFMESDIPISVEPTADLGHDYAMISDVFISMGVAGDILKEQYLYSNLLISVTPDADLVHLVNLYSDLNISIVVDATIAFGPTQSDVLSERRMVIEPKERTMVISPSDRTVTISCP